MKVQIICEGVSDRAILRALITRISGDIDIEVIEESKTQMKRRGKQSILLKYETFAKFLHQGYSKLVDIIIICVDSDGGQLDQFGIDMNTKNQFNSFIETFKIRNQERYSNFNPEFVFAIPVQTMDYWMKALDKLDDNCKRIREIEDINKNNIKSATYGAHNVFLGWIIDEKIISQKIEKIKNGHFILEKLRCFPSFCDFEQQLIKALKSKL